jgi:hypothetical protein
MTEIGEWWLALGCGSPVQYIRAAVHNPCRLVLPGKHLPALADQNKYRCREFMNYPG